MEKSKTSMQFIVNNFGAIFQTEAKYTDLIFFGRQADYYNAGQYGWNNDIYINYNKDIAICSGYRNLRGKEIPLEIVKKYSYNAFCIIGENEKEPTREIKLLDNQLKFFEELEHLKND